MINKCKHNDLFLCYQIPLQNVLLHVGTPCILVNDLLADNFLFKRGKFPFWELTVILQQWINLFIFAKRWKKQMQSWKFLYASLNSDEDISGIIKSFSQFTNDYYVVGPWFPGTLVGLSKLTEVFTPIPLLRKRGRTYGKWPLTHIRGPWDVLVSCNIDQNTAAWAELSSYDALTILIASATNNPRNGAIILPGNTNFVVCLFFYFKFLNKIFNRRQFKFSFNNLKNYKVAIQRVKQFKKKSMK